MPFPARTITAHGRTLTLQQWSAETGLPTKTICSRLDVLGWPPERAVAARADPRFRRGGRHRGDAPRPAPALREDGKGRAIARWRAFGQDHFRSFGAWGSDEANAAYRRFAAEWAAGAYDAAAPVGPAGLMVGELLCRWIDHVGREYRKLGRRTSEYHVCRAAGAVVNDLYGDTLANEFTPAKLRTVRAKWVNGGRARKTVNHYTYRIVACWKWAAGQSLVPPWLGQALAAVERVKAGKLATDRRPVRPVADDAVAATVAAFPPGARGDALRAMVAVQRLAGLRPQHLAEMRPADLDRGGEVWRYVPPPAGTKTYHLDKRPTFFLGPLAQAALAPLLDGCPADRPVFGYRLKAAKWYRLTVAAYRKAVGAACKRAGVPHWYPHQLRHALATAVAERFQSLDHAAAAIGDNPATAAAVYVHVDPRERARIEVARAMG